MSTEASCSSGASRSVEDPETADGGAKPETADGDAKPKVQEVDANSNKLVFELFLKVIWFLCAGWWSEETIQDPMG
jgi:hypothetical protein